METENKTAAPAPKRLGDLLLESGMLSAEDLSKGLDYSKKTSLPLGRVLVMLRLVSDQGLRSALQVQSLMKFENMPATLAVKAMALSKSSGISIDEACKQIGWSSDKFKSGMPARLRELKDALADAEQRLGPDHPELAATMMELSAFYADEMMWPHAEYQMETAIQKLEKAYGAVDLKVAQALTQMANLLFQQDRYAEAQLIYERVVTIRQQLLGPDDPDVGYALFDLAEVHDAQNRWGDAERLYLQSLKNLEQLYDCDEQPIIDVLRRLSYVCRRRNAPAEAILVGNLLTESGLVTGDQVNEALSYSKQNGVPLARALVLMNYLSEDELRPALHLQLLIKSNLIHTPLAIRALRLRVKCEIPLEEAISTIGWRVPSGQAYELGELFRTNDALIEAERTLPSDDPQIAVLCVRFAELFESFERYSDAEPLYKRAIGILEKTPDDIDGLILMLDRVGAVYIKQHKFDQAEAVYTRALELRMETLGENHPEMSTSYLNMGRMNAQRGKHEDAIAFLHKALPIAEEHYGLMHIEVANIVEQLALSYFHLGNHGRAEPLFWQAYNIKREHMDTRSHEIVGLLMKLAEMYNKDGKYTMADSVLILFQPEQSCVV